MELINITVSGPVGSGKSVLVREIKDFIESLNFAVVYSDPEHRNNPPDSLEKSQSHEKPQPNKVVVALNEMVTK